ncbi:MAG: hypothetical protein JWR21_3172 [Herminiimonas sp.]|nr:hypothetical protein [Herminiimonas sp.]MDB5854755.1 hypothetical protein [Herminiimonas sp.]
MKKMSTQGLMLLTGLVLAGSALAKLPAPTEEQKAKSAAEKEKTAWSDKVAGFQLCKAQDKVVAFYRKNTPQAKPESAAVATPACTDPGPMQATQAAANVGIADSKPVPAAGKPEAPAEKK